MSPNESVSRKRFPCLSTCTEPRSVALTIGNDRIGRYWTGATSICVIGSLEMGQSLGLVGHVQRIDQAVQVTVHDLRQRMHRDRGLGTMIRDPILREVVRADLVAAIAGADH